jgi:dihydroorotate dehydrogenase
LNFDGFLWPDKSRTSYGSLLKGVPWVDIYKRILRPILFKLDAEIAHNMARALLRGPILARFLGGESLYVRDDRLQVNMANLLFPNPVGLSAGFDKDCELAHSLEHFGFGYIVVGSVMCHPRAGNPRPRMIRDPQNEALFSCMGLPSKGLDYAVKRLRRPRHCTIPLIVNFNGVGFDDYLKCIEVLQPLGDALEVVLFCPNRPQDAGDFLSPRVAEKLLGEMAKRKKKPVFIKIPGYRSDKEQEKRLRLVDHILKYPVDGITITPDSLVDERRLSIGRGTITGRPMFQQMLNVVRDVYDLTRGKCHIKASGGISTSKDAFEALAAGASLLEIYTGFIYEGWNIARNINLGLLDLLNKHCIRDVQALRGAQVKLLSE